MLSTGHLNRRCKLHPEKDPSHDFREKVRFLNGLHKHEHLTHFRPGEAFAVYRRARPGQAFFTPVSHQISMNKVVQDKLPDNIYLPCDGLKTPL